MLSAWSSGKVHLISPAACSVMSVLAKCRTMGLVLRCVDIKYGRHPKYLHTLYGYGDGTETRAGGHTAVLGVDRCAKRCSQTLAMVAECLPNKQIQN